MAREHPVLAIDIGGTKVAAGLVEPGGRLASWAQTETPRGLEAEQLWRTLEVLCERLLAEARVDERTGLAGVGCGCGGPMEWPAGRGRRSMLGMVVSTGVGGGLVLDGRLINGPTGNAGHIGHVVVDPGGPFCVCGGRGCLEAIARGPALVAWAQGEGWRPGQSPVTAKDLADDAAQGHPVGIAAMRRAGGALGIAIASATHLCDLEVVAIGGGLAQAGPLLFEPLEEALRTHVGLAYARDVPVVPAALGQSAGLIGAAALIFAADRYWAGG